MQKHYFKLTRKLREINRKIKRLEQSRQEIQLDMTRKVRSRKV